MRDALFALVALLLAPAATSAQLISIRTIPVAAGDQFQLFPSQTAGMGGVSIAIDDPLHDPFVNPAKGARITTLRFLTSPTFYDITSGHGRTFSLPVSLLARSGRWFGGGGVAMQQLESGTRFRAWGALPDRAHSNIYAYGFGGWTLPGGTVSLGASAFVSDLSAVDGVALMYPRSIEIDQSGTSMDFRIAMLAELGGDRSLEAIFFHDRLSMTHDVTYANPARRVSADPETIRETNIDRTNTWGLHLGYVQAVGEHWRLGGILTGNFQSHPKIPNYDLSGLARDPGPGTSWAYNIGAGITRVIGPATVALEAIFEPIRTHTWAEANAPAGSKTVDNRFTFANAIFRLGADRDMGTASLQLGLELRSVNYRLVQQDRLQGTVRRQSEHWLEWAPTVGATVRFPQFDLHYAGRLTIGRGQPFLRSRRQGVPVLQGFLLAPGGALSLADALVHTHQLTVSLPIG